MLAHLVAASLALVPLAARPAEAPGSASARLGRLRGAYVEGLFRAKPHLASYLGERRYDSLVQDLSRAAVARRVRELAGQQRALSLIERDRLSPEERVDADVLADGIALELVDLRDIREWTWNPRLVDDFVHFDPREMVASRLSDLVHGSGPANERLAAVTAQLRALPRHLAQRLAAFDAVSKVHLDQAVKDNAGRIAFFDGELAELTWKHPEAEKARATAVEALRRYQHALETELPARATRDFRLGHDLYRKRFPHALQTATTPEQMVARATEALRGARTELYEVARRLHARMWPREPAPAAAAPAVVQARVIVRVKDEIAKDHPTAEGMVAASAARLDGLRAFIESKRLVGLPPADSLRVEPMPAYKRAGIGAEYLSPGLLGDPAKWKGIYYVEPPDSSWPKERIESYLRGWNDAEIALTAAHEAYPGHHVQMWWSLRDRSPLRTALWSPTFAEGWAVYSTTLVVESGYGGDASDRYRFTDLRGWMRAVANAILDARLQGGDMTDAEAIRFMVEETFQEPAQAQSKLQRAKLDSTQLSQYFIGTVEIRELEAEARAKGPFDRRAFDEALVSHGTIAVRHLRPLVLGR